MQRFVRLLALLATPAFAGSEFQLTFPANPSTGYRWVLNESASTGIDLVVVEDRGFGPPETNLIGAPAPALFAVRCTGPGPVKLVFDYTAPDGATVTKTGAAEISCD